VAEANLLATDIITTEMWLVVAKDLARAAACLVSCHVDVDAMESSGT